MTHLSFENIDANSRNQEWLMLAKQADHNPDCIETMRSLLPHLDPYENKCILARCCAQFGYIQGLKSLLPVCPNTDWERVMAAAVMGNQKKSVEMLLAHIDPQQSVKESATILIPNQALRLCIERDHNDILHLLIAVVPTQYRTAVLLWTLEEYNYAMQKGKPTEMFEHAVEILCATTNGTSLLSKNSELPLNTPARDVLAEILSKHTAVIGEMSLNLSLKKMRV